MWQPKPTTLPTEPIQLTEEDLLPFGLGKRRHCYAYPSDISLCIKIPLQGELKHQKREVRFYKQLARRGVPTDRITNYHGEVETSKGTGYVYDIVRDADGSPSKRLDVFLRDEPERGSEYIQILNTLEDYLFDYRVVFYDINRWNVLCQQLEDGSLEPFIIDGVGDVVAIPLLNSFDRLLRRKMERRWRRWIHGLEGCPWISEYTFSHTGHR